MSQNGYAVNTQWYTQNVVGVLDYVIDTNMPVVQSNCEFVLAGFHDLMHQVHGSRTCVPTRRTVRSNYMDELGLLPPRVNLQTTEGDWYRREFGNMWRMNEKVRDQALDRAGLC